MIQNYKITYFIGDDVVSIQSQVPQKAVEEISQYAGFKEILVIEEIEYFSAILPSIGHLKIVSMKGTIS